MTKNRTWILLRGLTREHRHWGEFFNLLSKQYSNDKIIAPDLPGNGIHSQINSPINIHDTMQLVRREVLQQSNSSEFYFVALSLGAMVAMDWVQHYPKECKTAFLMNTSFAGINPFYRRLKPQNYFQILEMLLLNNNLHRRERSILNLTSYRHFNNENLVIEWMNYAKQNPVKRSNAIRQIIAASRYRLPERKPDVPLYLLCGMQDNLANAECSQKFAAYWQLPIKYHPQAGHDITLDAPSWVCEQIDQFIMMNK